MTTQENFGDAPGPQAPVHPGRGQPFQFSNDELRVLRECNRDSFFQRCLPIGTLLGVATYYGVKAGHLKASPRWGSTPKVVVASIIGYFIGKISYQSKCAEKIMQLPDSRLGAILRQRKRGTGFQESLEPGYGSGMSLGPFSAVNPADTYTDLEPSGAPDIDTTRPDHSGLDDSNRPSLDSNPVFEEETMPPVQDKSTTYDELRQRNREEYQKHRTASYKGLSSTAEAPQVRRPSYPAKQELSSGPSSAPKRTNMYGDVME